ncbi:hypothetical protein HY024_03345 [Candidatus Curtissbacteria bacterium]|nr:hypothetical protein [Candidatus Curtissbacteria bacterium]
MSNIELDSLSARLNGAVPEVNWQGDFSVIDPLPSRIVSPEGLGQAISQHQVRYVELSGAIQFDWRFVNALRQIRGLGLPLAVCASNYHDTSLAARQGVNHFLSRLSSVDYVVDAQAQQNISLPDREASFFSNVHYLSGAVGATTRERIRRGKSAYQAGLERMETREGKYVRAADLPDMIGSYQDHGKKVVVITGVFDVLHPVHPLVERMAVLGAVDVVDHVVAFDELTAEGIIGQLQHIIYAKTLKDVVSDGVRREMALVALNGGETAILAPIIDPTKGTDLSSTEVIFNVLNGGDTEFDPESVFEEFPLLAREKFFDVLVKIQESEDYSALISVIKSQLAHRYDESLEKCAQIEEASIEGIIELTQSICDSMPVSREYNKFVVPYVIGKVLGLDIGIIPIQHNVHNSPSEVVNVLKQTDGNIVFFNATGLKVGPLSFDRDYWKNQPYATNYMHHDTEFPLKRVFLHPTQRHVVGTSLKILLEDYKHLDPGSIEALFLHGEVSRHTRRLWETFTEEPFALEDDNKLQSLRPEVRLEGLPQIVGHGGSKTKDIAGGFGQNTRSGILEAMELGVNVVEIDLVPCRDGWLAAHDRLLDVSTFATGYTTDFTEDQLQGVEFRLTNGEPSGENILPLRDALTLVADYRQRTGKRIGVKIDLKYSEPALEPALIDIVQASGIPIADIVATANVFQYEQRLHKLLPELPLELNTAEVNAYLHAYDVMDELLMPDTGIHRLGMSVQAWVINSFPQFLQYAAMGSDFVLIHDLKLMQQVAGMRKAEAAQNA